MVRNPFRSEPPTPEPDPTITIQNQIDELEQKAFKLKGLIMATQHHPTKIKLQTQRANILQQINTLKQQQYPRTESQASLEIDKLFRENLYIVEVRGQRTKPDKNLTIPLTFSCGHKQKIHVKEILRFQRTPISEGTLLSKLQGIFNAKATLEAKFYCPECKKAKDKQRRKEHRYSDLPSIGTVTVTLKVI